jgi:threonine/homoserine/homoserine lactone efflux protein
MDPFLLSLAGFAVAMYITPGPNNVMVAASAANHGVRASVPHMLGINAGFSLMLVLVCGGLGGVLLSWPTVLRVMRWLGAAWMLLLAWKIAAAPPPGEADRRPLLGFWGAAAFQWVNPKAWMIAVGAASQFLRADLPLGGQLLRIGAVFLAVGLPCLLPWAMLGDAAGRLLHSPARLRVFNVSMALLLVASLVPLLMEG